MSSLYFYADDASQKILAGDAQKIISIGSDFGYGNFGDVLQHINALRAIKKAGRFATVSVMAAKAINSQAFPSFVSEAYKTDAVIFVTSYPLILADTDPQLTRVAEVRNVAGLWLYGGGFLNSMWGDFVLSVVEHFLRLDQEINYWVSGQQITTPFEARVLEHIKVFHPKLFGVRDEVSLRLLAERGYDADFSFDDATEALEGLSDRLSIRQGQGLALHINSSDYTGNTSLADGLGRELASVASQDAARHEVTVFQAFRDSRQDVFDSSETIKRLDYLFPFHEYRTIDLVGLLFDQSSSNKKIKLDLALGYSCSYHVTLWLQLAGIPCWLRSSNSFYDQKSRALQVSQGLDEFLRNPKLADHTSNLERRATWNDKLQRHLSSIDPIENCLCFENIESGPAPWSFFYKGHPTLQDKLSSAEKDNLWLKSRAEVAERDLGATRSENVELQGRVTALSAQLTEVCDEAHRQRERAEVAERDLGATRSENVELQGRVTALSAQLTEVGNEAHRQRERAEVAERDLVATRSENAELHGRVEALSTQISVILASRSWRLTRGLRVLGRLFRGEFGAVFAALRQRFTRHRS